LNLWTKIQFWNTFLTFLNYYFRCKGRSWVRWSLNQKYPLFFEWSLRWMRNVDTISRRTNTFYFPNRKKYCHREKKKSMSFLTNFYVLRSQESETLVFKKCRVYSVHCTLVLCDGCLRRKYHTSGANPQKQILYPPP